MDKVKEITNAAIDAALQYRKETDDKLEQICKENKDKIINGIIKMFSDLNNTAELLSKIYPELYFKEDCLRIDVDRTDESSITINSIKYMDSMFKITYYVDRDVNTYTVCSSTDKSFYDKIDHFDIPYLYNALKKYISKLNNEMVDILNAYNDDSDDTDTRVAEIKSLVEGL